MRLFSKTLPFLLYIRVPCCPRPPLSLLQLLLRGEHSSLSRLNEVPNSSLVPLHPRRKQCSPILVKEGRPQKYLSGSWVRPCCNRFLHHPCLQNQGLKKGVVHWSKSTFFCQLKFTANDPVQADSTIWRKFPQRW